MKLLGEVEGLAFALRNLLTSPILLVEVQLHWTNNVILAFGSVQVKIFVFRALWSHNTPLHINVKEEVYGALGNYHTLIVGHRVVVSRGACGEGNTSFKLGIEHVGVLTSRNGHALLFKDAIVLCPRCADLAFVKFFAVDRAFFATDAGIVALHIVGSFRAGLAFPGESVEELIHRADHLLTSFELTVILFPRRTALTLFAAGVPYFVVCAGCGDAG